jgi:hypothetical protein
MLAEAIRLTFKNRETEIPSEASSFRKEFIVMKEAQWKAFRNKLDQGRVPESFEALSFHSYFSKQ